MLPKLPQHIDYFINGAVLVADEIGESPCSVYHFLRGNERFFLKYSPAVYAGTTYSVMREASVLNWLVDRLNVPEVVSVAESPAGEFMITRGVPGEPLSTWINSSWINSTEINVQQPVLARFQQALHQVQAVSIADCPFDSGANMRLRELEYLLRNGLYDEQYDFTPWPGITTPQGLLTHLYATLPDEERVFSHGDLGDSNIFVDAHGELYFIDLGRGGVADRWLDIAFVHRNLREEVSVAAATALLDTLGDGDNPAKRVFFEQLDELF
ncbi:MAG: aminoglycoside 3'-phosphotransferase [Enterobacteriaceae bacterium]|jgi:kanamycin kinase|nr:aminoglycoside 3'-phosphotransferase [Enterobacteriaceae bacterium]